MKILIVEDEEILVKVLQEKFQKENFKVEFTTEGDMVLPLAKKFNPDIILLDILLPKMNGLDVLTNLKFDEDLKNIPVIIISNIDEDQKIKQALELGAVDYLIKSQHPINEVVEMVNKHVLKAK
ncbi:MAG: response regulator [Candidatus Paceibacterota bacterium]|jgi:DNA-binding response OmpR family regulator